MISIHEKISGLNVDADIPEGFYQLYGDSSSGKSFLLRILNEYCIVKQISCCFVDYRSYQEKTLVVDEKFNCEVILLDNGTLYATEELLEQIVSYPNVKYVLVETNDYLGMRSVKNGTLHVNSDKDGLSAKVFKKR